MRLESQDFDNKLKSATANLQHMEREVRRTGATFEYADKEELEFIQSLGQMQTKALDTSGKMKELTKSFTELSIVYKNLTDAEKSAPYGRAFSESLDQLKVRIKSLQGDLNAVNAQMGNLNKGGGGFGGGIMKGLGGAAAAFGPAALAAGAAAAAISGVKAAVGDYLRINKEFEQASANLAAVMGTTRENTRALTDQAKQLGSTTQYTAVQITELQTNLAKLGFTEGEILNSTKAVQNLATATGADLGSAADLAGAALRSFGLNATEMDRVTSVLAVSTTKSALSFDKLQVAMPIVGTAASKMGFSIEDTVALLGKLVDTGMDASTAATALRNIFLKMADPSSKMSAALGDNIHSLDQLIPALQKCKDDGMDLGEMFGIAKERGTVAFATLVDGADTLGELRDSITDCSSALQGMVDEQMNTAEGATLRLSSAWEGLMLSMGNADGLTKAKNAMADFLGWIQQQGLREGGGDGAIGTYAQGVTDDAKKRMDAAIELSRQQGKTDEEINASSKKRKEALEAEVSSMMELVQKLEATKSSWKGDYERNQMLPEVEQIFGKDVVSKMGWEQTMQNMYKQVAKMKDSISSYDYVITATETPKVEGTPELEVEPVISAKSLADLEDELKEAQKAQKASTNNADYDAAQKSIDAIQAAIDKIKGSSKEAAKATKEVFEEGSIGYMQQKLQELDKQWKSTTDADTRATLKKQIDEVSKSLDEMTGKSKKDVEVPLTFSEDGINNLGKQIKEKMSKLDFGSGDYLIAADNLVDFNTLQTLINTAIKNGLDFDKEWFNSLFEDVKIGENVDPSTWQAVIDEINRMLAEKGLDPIKVNLDTGSLEETKKQVKSATEEMQEYLSNMSSGVGAISTIGNAFNDLKGIGEDLASAFSGDMDAWDAMMTVFNSGISIMQTVMGVMEAINTLTELSTSLKGANTAATELEATTAQTSAMTEVTAEGEKQMASELTTGTNTMEAASGAGKAMSAIPIVGPILAVAAIAAVLAAIMASKSKAKSVGKFAGGGVVGGNSYSGDRLMAYVNSGETILTPSQADKAMAGIQGNPMQNLQLSTEISGTNLRVVLNNDNRSKGGSRGYYANIH